MKKNGAKGLAYLCFDAEGVKGSIAKFFTPEEMDIIKTKTGAKEGDSVLFVADAVTIYSPVVV